MDEIGGDPGATLWHGGLATRLDAFDRLLTKASVRFPRFGALHETFPINGRGLLLFLLAMFLLLLLPPLVRVFLRRAGRLEPNFRGDVIPQSYGLLILLFTLAMMIGVVFLLPSAAPDYSRWIVAVVGFGGLGLLDDWRGTKKIRGLRGHFRAAFRERTITTGFLKAAGGMALALWLGTSVRTDGRIAGLVAAGVIALSANAINLLDLRPGRAGGVFLLLSFPLLLFGFHDHLNSAGVPPLLFVVLAAWRVWEQDSRGLAMMGDTGSNLLGAALGLALMQSSASLPILCIVLVALGGLHALAERVSLSALIERTPLLRRLDRLTGVR